jgi:chitinase
VGRHRKRQRRQRRRVRIALLSTGLLVPLTGGAVVFAATDKDPGRPAAATAPRPGNAAARRAEADASSQPRPMAGPASHSPSRPPTPAPSTPPPPPPGPKVFAPYADVLTWPPLDLSKADVKAYTMGFVAAGGGCSAAWGGLSPVDAGFAVHRIKEVPGQVIVSFGGPHGTELAQSCESVDSLVKQYRKALDATDPAGIDFYLTDGMLSDTASVQRRTQALTRIQRDDLTLSITLPLHRSGLSASALAALRSALTGGLRVSIVNLVPADGAGQSVTASATAAHGQLQRLYHESDTEVWRRMGVTPVIGVAGVGAQFAPADAQQVLSWAGARGLGRLSMWSVTRDTPCTVDTSVAGDTCSGLDEDTGAFTKIFQTF